MQFIRQSSARRGFTVVELLVAAAVAMVLMLIITEAFKHGLDMFRTLKAQGDMMERLRVATITMRDDLASYHFEGNGRPGYLSQEDMLQPTWLPPEQGFFRITQSSMDLVTGNPFIAEGTDRENILFTRATSHNMHFTVYRRETSPTVKFPVDPSYLFRTAEPTAGAHPSGTFPYQFIDPPDFRETGIYASRWSEVAYFLVPNGNSANGLPLFNLHRRSKLLLPPGNPGLGIPFGPVPANPGSGYVENPEISARTQFSPGPPAPSLTRFYNTTQDITQPRNRMGMEYAASPADPNAAGFLLPGVTYAGPPAHGAAVPGSTYPALATDLIPFGLLDARAGDDVLTSDVLSFEIKATWDFDGSLGSPAPAQTLNVPGLGVVPNTDWPFDYIPLSPRNTYLSARGIRVFDTWSNGGIYTGWDSSGTPTSIPLRIKLKAIQIRLRVWNSKMEQTRQITIIQEM